MSNEHRRPVIVVTLAAILLFSGLSKGGLSGYDDALYAHEAREMLTSGDWQNVRFNGDLNFEYPPLFLWLDATSMWVFGANDFAAKLPAALAGLATLWLLYWIAVELRSDAWYAILGMIVLATTQPFLKYSSHAMTDVPFTFLFTLSLWLYLKGLKAPRWFLLSGVAVGMTVLTRPVVGILPLIVVAIHLLLARKVRVLVSPQWTGGCLLAIAVPMLWFWPQYQAHGTQFIEGHLAFVGRKLQDTQTGLQLVPYGKELLQYYWPWLPIFVAGLVYQYRRAKFALAPIWILIVLAPLTQTAIPYGRYLMPAYPAMALVCAVALFRWIPQQQRSRYFQGACIVMTLIGAFTILFPASERGLDMRTVAPIAEAHSQPDQRILLYTFGEQRFDFHNQLLWYSDRYTNQIMDMDELVAEHVPGAVGIIDKASFERLPDRDRLEQLGESEQFVAYRVERSN